MQDTVRVPGQALVTKTTFQVETLYIIYLSNRKMVYFTLIYLKILIICKQGAALWKLVSNGLKSLVASNTLAYRGKA